MSEQPPHQFQPSHDWGSALIAACLALGFAMSWGAYEVRQRLAEEQSAADVRHDLDVLVGQQSDLGHLLADPRTRLARLAPADGGSPVRFADIAWNNETRSGVLFCDGLSVQQNYQILLVSASGAATAVVLGPTEAGRTVYPISATPGDLAPTPSEILLNTPAGATLARGKFAD
jgi:hypothetical protein